MSSRAMSVVIVLGLAVLLIANSLFIVSERERGVQLRFGQIVEADLKPGLHMKIPFVDRIRIFDGRLQALDVPQARFLTQEQKAVVVDAYIKWQIMDVQKFYKATNGDLFRVNQLLTQRADSRLRNQFGSLTLNEVVSGRRDEMLQEITSSLKQRCVR